ncbi:MAG: response regulator transcription factor [Candidatus Hydrogenedentota bacterium]
MTPADILVVEDEPDLARNIRILLRGYGYASRIATTLAEGLAELAAKQPDILILDIMLPDGNGLEILRKIRLDPAQSNLAVIVLSSLAQKKEIEAGFAVGANAYVPKPYDPEKLLSAIQLLLAEKR